MRRRFFCLVLASLAASSGPALSSEQAVPTAVSPGGLAALTEVLGGCPTFSWTVSPGESEQELLVWELDQEHEPRFAPETLTIRKRLPRGAGSWTPPAAHCLSPGGHYAWTVGALNQSSFVAADWSAPRFFEIASLPSAQEVRDALSVLQRYVRHASEVSADGLIALAPGLGITPADAGAGGQPQAPLLAPVSTLIKAEILGSTDLVAGIFGSVESTEPLSVGVLGRYTGGANNGTGVRGETTSGLNGRAVHGLATASSGSTFGVSGQSDSTSGFGVSGFASATSGPTVGVVGQSKSPSGMGGFFKNTAGGVGLQVTANPCCSEATKTHHAAIITNSQFTGDPDVLALVISRHDDPGSSFNFITFFDQFGSVGAIEGNGGGIQINTTSADFAEHLPKLDPGEDHLPGQVLGVRGGRVGFATSGVERVLVVTSQPIILGNAPQPEEKASFTPVAFLGRVPVRTRGPVRSGDLLLASGLDDGAAIAIDPQALRRSQLPLIVGRATETSAAAAVKPIQAIVGLPEIATLQGLLLEQELRLNRLEAGLPGFGGELAAAAAR